ncbi:MAG: acyltransferase family protein [Verrucomicrobiaceae bacterium]
MSESRTHYYPHIDGLRAIAVLGVLLFHAELGFPGGYVGVDVFFVISGYLLTGLMLRDAAAGRFSTWHFWERRTRRIFPALAVVIVACFAAAWLLLMPSDFKRFASSVIAQAILASNLYFARLVGYFDQAASMKPLLHTWSLAVEEQFYLFFPLLFVVLRRGSRPLIILAILLLGCLSFGFGVYYDGVRPWRNFYLLPSRAWELLTGAFLAAIPMQRAFSRWLGELISGAGLLAIVYVMLQDDQMIRFPGRAAMLACAGAAAIIWANGHTMTTVGRLLSVRPVVFVGLISYSLYLWHWPLLAFARYWNIDPLPGGQRVLLLLACVVLATMTWRFVETPFRTRRVVAGRGRLVMLTLSTSAVLSLAAYGIHRWSGVPSRFPPAAVQYLDEATHDLDVVAEMSIKVDVNKALAGDFPELGTGDKNMPVEVLLWGDSHAASLMPLLDALCKENHVRGVAAVHAGTPPLIGYQSLLDESDGIAFNNAVVEFIRRNHVGNVILVARWGLYVDGVRSHEALAGTVKVLKDTNANTRIWIMRQVPNPIWPVPEAVALKVIQGCDPEDFGIPLAEHQLDCQRQSSLFEGIAGESAQVTVLDPTALFVNPQKQLCRVVANGRVLFCDDDHLSAAGAHMLRPLFVPAFQGIIQSKASSAGDKGAKR